MIVRYFFFFIILTFYACSSNENVLLELALDNSGENRSELEAVLAYIIHSGFISGYQNRYGDNLKPPTNVYHRMTA